MIEPNYWNHSTYKYENDKFGKKAFSSLKLERIASIKEWQNKV